MLGSRFLVLPRQEACYLRRHTPREGGTFEVGVVVGEGGPVEFSDIQVALSHLQEAIAASTLSLVGTSFGGGLCAYYAAKRPNELVRLVLLNPQLNYKDRYIDQKQHWHDDHLDDEAARQLGDQGFIRHSPTVKHGRAMLNEVFWIKPIEELSQITAPTLIIHGTQGHVRVQSMLHELPTSSCASSSAWSRSRALSTASRCMRIRSTWTAESGVAGVRHPHGDGVDHG